MHFACFEDQMILLLKLNKDDFCTAEHCAKIIISEAVSVRNNKNILFLLKL